VHFEYNNNNIRKNAEVKEK